jgi:glutathione S-transferase
MEGVWPRLEQLKNFLGEDKLFLAGDALTWIDFYFFELCLYLDYISGEVVLKFYSNLDRYVKRI